MIGEAAAAVWLSTDDLLAEFGTRRVVARRKYQQFVAEGMGAESIWKYLKAHIYLGDDEFVERTPGKLGEWGEAVNIPKAQQRERPPSSA